jgi:hypothetical protein
LWGDNVTKWNLTIVDTIIAWLAQKTNEIFGRLMQV